MAVRRKGVNEGTTTCVPVLQEMATEGDKGVNEGTTTCVPVLQEMATEGDKSVNEGTTTCVPVLQEMATEGEVVFSVINVSDCVTKTAFGNVRECRSLLFDVPPPVARETFWEVGRVASWRCDAASAFILHRRYF